MAKIESVKANILKEAALLFSERGYERTSMREIAERTGVSKPAIYYHFANKQSLFEELINTSFEISKQRMEEIANSDRDPIQQLKDLAIARFQSTKENPEMMRFIYDLTAGNIHKTIALDHKKVFSKHQQFLSQIINNGKQLRLLKQDLDDIDFTMIYIGTINMYIMSYLKGYTKELSDQKAEQIVDLLLNGIKK
ncbi:TetR/AcrR family transcriptional regulator [Candidatus Neomarinimicrobiota bacterium]